MGIPELWQQMGDGEITSLAQLSVDHFKRTGRPFRVAIDEAGWRFNNVNDAQVFAIREKSGQPYNGNEKGIFYRLAKLLRLNIQPLFVFDGPHRPWKRGRPAGRIDYDRTRLLKEMLRLMKIPYHEAPGEAEAECARLEQEGIVDAVWSEDADALMFGSEFLIRDRRVGKRKSDVLVSASKEGTKKDTEYVRVYRMEKVRQTLRIDREGIACFVLLVGGDYDKSGLKGCGAAKAFRAAKNGLGRTLCRCKSRADLLAWREELDRFFKGNVQVPFDFPNEKHVRNYTQPQVSSVKSLHNLRGLRHGWDAPIDEQKLWTFLGERFNFWTERYMHWMAPIFLVRSLIAQTKELQVPRDNRHDVRIARRRRGKDAPDLERELETKVSFAPRTVSHLDYSKLPAGHWKGAEDIPADLDYRVEKVEVLEIFLRNALPEEVFTTLAAKGQGQRGKKRKATEEDDETEAQAPPARGQAQAEKTKATDKGNDAEAGTSAKDQTQKSKKRKTSEKGLGGSSASKPKLKYTKKKDKDHVPKSSSPKSSPKSSSRPRFRMPPGYPLYHSTSTPRQNAEASTSFGLTDDFDHMDDSSDGEDLDMRLANEMSLKNPGLRISSPSRTMPAPSSTMVRDPDVLIEDDSDDEQLKLAMQLSLKEIDPRTAPKEVDHKPLPRMESRSLHQPVPPAFISADASLGVRLIDTPPSQLYSVKMPVADPPSQSTAVSLVLQSEKVRAARLAYFLNGSSTVENKAEELVATSDSGVAAPTCEEKKSSGSRPAEQPRRVPEIIDLTDD